MNEILNQAVADSLDDFSYAQSIAESYVREQLLTPEERKAAERADRIETIVCGIMAVLSAVVIGVTMGGFV